MTSDPSPQPDPDGPRRDDPGGEEVDPGSDEGEGEGGADAELTRLIDAYLAGVEAGAPPDPDRLLAENPALADRLRACLSILTVFDSLSTPADLEARERGGITQVGDFRLIRPIGRGGMGLVYEAEQVSLARRVAFKILPMASALDLKCLRRFRLEARAAGYLHHPHIVPVFAFGTERGIHYYAMKYIDGRSLAQLIAGWRRSRGTSGPGAAGPGAEGPAEPDEPTTKGSPGQDDIHPAADGPLDCAPSTPAFFALVARLGLQAAEALEHSHQRGVLHRDIKPANLLIDALGALWVSDFGLARLKEGGDQTQTQELVGTMRYMSPERALGQQAVADERVDVYALGASLYEALTLRPLYEGEDRQRLIRQIAEDEPVPPRRIDPSIPGDLETIVRKAIARDPRERYATAGELADDLRRFLEGKPIVARRPSLLRQVRRWGRRHSAAVLLSLAVVALASLTAAVLLARQRGDGLGPDESQRALRYADDVSQAFRFIQNTELEEARKTLARQIPRSSARRDLRTFPWYYLWNLCAPKSRPRILQARGDDVYHVEFSPDGRRLAWCSKDGTVRLCELATGKVVRELRGDQGEVNWVAFSPDGRTVATTGDDGTLKLWDVDRGVLETTLGKQDSELIAVVFSKDGSRLIEGGRSGLLRVWDRATGRVTRSFRAPAKDGSPPWIGCLALSPDDTTLAVALGSAGAILWEIEGGKVTPLVTEPADAVTAVAFSPRGDVVLAAGSLGMARILDPGTGQSLGRLGVYTDPDAGPSSGPIIEGLDCSPDDRPDLRTVALCDETGSIRVGDATSLALMNIFLGHRGKVWCVRFSPDGRLIASAGSDGTVRLWEHAHGENEAVHHFDVSPGGDRRSLIRIPGFVLSAGFTPGGDLAVVNAVDGSVTRWNGSTGAPVATAPIDPPAHVVAAKLAGDGMTLGLVDDLGSFALWDISGPRPALLRRVPRLVPPRDASRRGAGPGIAFSRDGSTVGFAEPTQGLLLWDRASGRIRRSPRVEASNLQFSSRGDFVVAGVAKQPVVWHPGTDELLSPQSLGHILNGLVSIALSIDDKRIATGDSSGTILLWDAETLECLAQLSGHHTWLKSLAFSPDGMTLAAAGADGTVRFWDTATHHAIMTIAGQGGDLLGLHFSRDGAMLASCSSTYTGDDSYLYFWPAPRDRGMGR